MDHQTEKTALERELQELRVSRMVTLEDKDLFAHIHKRLNEVSVVEKELEQFWIKELTKSFAKMKAKVAEIMSAKELYQELISHYRKAYPQFRRNFFSQ